MNEAIAKVMISTGTAAQPGRRSRTIAGGRGILCPGKRAVSRRLFLAALAVALLSGSVRSAPSVSTVDGGGHGTVSADYRMEGSISSIGGISTAVTSAITVRHGYIGQLYDVTSLVVTSVPAPVNEDSTSQLGAIATLDDETILVVAGAEVNWRGAAYPIASIDASGLATAAVVYTNTMGLISGYYLGASNSASLLVLDSDPDNYGLYAGDSTPDWWQVQYFGLDNTSGLGGVDGDGDGQNNLQEYLAGTNPTNNASVFRVVGVARQSQDMLITWSAVGGKRYMLQTTTGRSGSYSNNFVDLNPPVSVPGTGATTYAVLHLGGATNRPAFYYRIRLVP
jgi:hypothetical protein